MALMVDPSDLDPDRIARREFTTTFRGFDQVEVRAFLSSVSLRLSEALDRERDLMRRVDEAEARQIEAEDLDEHRLTALLGEETARIFEAAREAAAEIRAKAEAKTAQLVRDAQDEASRMTTEAAELLRLRTTEAETAAAAVRSEADERASRLVGDAEAEAEALRVQATSEAESLRSEAHAEVESLRAAAQADADAMRAEAQAVLDQATADAAAAVEEGRQHGRDMVAEAQIVRERILKDLARRRRSGKAQLEQLRAARERLLDAYALVRRTLDEATTELTVAVPEAKLAADAAGRRVEADDDELTVEAIEAELDAGRVAGVPLLDTGEVPVVRVTTARSSDSDEEPSDQAGLVQPEPVQPESDAVGDETEPVTLRVVDALPDDAEPVAEDELVDETELFDQTDLAETDLAETDLAEPGDDAEGGTVEDLFARIRSEVPASSAVVPDSEATDGDETEPELDVALEIDAEIPGGDDVDDDPDELLLEQRDRYMLGLEADLARVLKRQLADDENDKLDLIRRRPAKGVATEVLPALEEHRVALVDAVTVPLALAGRSGGEFALDVLDPDRDPDQAPDLDVDELAVQLADELLVPIRARVSELASGTDPDDALDGVRACYRQWKGHVADLAAQYVHTAFNQGVYAALDDGTPVRWVVDPGAGPCPDGEDDALEGTVARGTPFPTGHLHPPAHPGCRCLLVPGVL
jgi:DivIVA domain-containing protein